MRAGPDSSVSDVRVLFPEVICTAVGEKTLKSSCGLKLHRSECLFRDPDPETASTRIHVLAALAG